MFLRFKGNGPVGLLPAVFVLAVIFSGCKKDAFKPTWQTKWLAPFFNTELRLTQLVHDTLLITNPDGSLQLVYNNTIFQWNPNDAAIRIPDTTVRNSFKVSALTLADQEIQYDYTLGQFASTMGLVGQFIMGSHNQEILVPAIPPQPPTDFPVDASQFFQAAVLNTGFIDVNIRNGFPVPIQNLEVELRNSVQGDVIGSAVFPFIPAGATQMQTIDLSGKYVEGQLTARLLSLESPGSDGQFVMIDTTDAIELTLLARDMTVQEATAVFPEQNVVDEIQETRYTIDGGAKLTSVRVKEGKLKLTIYSTLPQESFVTYNMPSASINNIANISFLDTLPPASGNNPTLVHREVNLAGYTIDLRGADLTKYNTFASHLTVRLDSTGIPVTLSANDSVYIDYSLTDIVPYYVRGYLGQQIINVGPETSALPLFSMVQSGSVGLQDLSVGINILNSLGAEGRISIHELKSIRTQTGNTVSLSAPAFMNQPLFVPRATDNPLTPSLTTFQLNSQNSNIKQWLENLPDQVSYKMDVFLNPYGNTANYSDFAYTDARVSLNMHVELPLALVANALVLRDTIGFNALGNTADGIREARLYLYATNGFPLAANVSIQLLDEFEWPLGTITNAPLELKPGITNAACVVSHPVQSVLELPVPADKVTWLRRAKYAVITAQFDTHAENGCNDYLKIYDWYTLVCKLTGHVVYDVTP